MPQARHRHEPVEREQRRTVCRSCQGVIENRNYDRPRKAEWSKVEALSDRAEFAHSYALPVNREAVQWII